jgi:hypothetical protein
MVKQKHRKSESFAGIARVREGKASIVASYGTLSRASTLNG